MEILEVHEVGESIQPSQVCLGFDPRCLIICLLPCIQFIAHTCDALNFFYNYGGGNIGIRVSDPMLVVV